MTIKKIAMLLLVLIVVVAAASPAFAAKGGKNGKDSKKNGGKITNVGVTGDRSIGNTTQTANYTGDSCTGLFGCTQFADQDQDQIQVPIQNRDSFIDGGGDQFQQNQGQQQANQVPINSNTGNISVPTQFGDAVQQGGQQ